VYTRASLIDILARKIAPRVGQVGEDNRACLAHGPSSRGSRRGCQSPCRRRGMLAFYTVSFLYFSPKTVHIPYNVAAMQPLPKSLWDFLSSESHRNLMTTMMMCIARRWIVLRSILMNWIGSVRRQSRNMLKTSRQIQNWTKYFRTRAKSSGPSTVRLVALC